MNTAANSLNWFEIPAKNILRSKKFYESIFSIEMPLHEMFNTTMAFFPMESNSGKVSGALAESKDHVPGKTGTVIYLNANPNMNPVLEKVKKSGGKILLPKTNIGENGFMAFIEDTEGNRIGIHSME